jgi:YD repeat-containing protein
MTANVSYTYDSMGRPNTMTDNVAMTAMIASATYGPANELTGLTGSGLGGFGGLGGESRSYNSIKQLTNISSGSGGSYASMTYHYPATSNNGKIDYQHDNVSGDQVNYTYDALNRLITAATSNTSEWGQAFTYDGFGNLTGVTTTQGTAPGLTSGFGSVDLNGNPATIPAPATYSGSASATYDVENRLAEVGGPLDPAVCYSYAPGNKRVWRGSWTTGGTRGTDTITFWGVNGQRLGDYAVTQAYGIGVMAEFYPTETSVNYYFGGS